MDRSRTIFANQPAIHFILDLRHPMSTDHLRLITQALQNVLVLATHMRGSPRVPFFAMSVLSFKFENVVPLQQLKENAGNILKLIADFTAGNKKNCGCALSQPDFLRIFSEGVEKIIQDFQFNDGNKQRLVGKVDSPSDLHISFLTRKETSCQILMESMLTCLSASRTTKLQVVALISSKSLSQDKTTNYISNIRFFEFLKVPIDSLAMENYFKTWLEDSTKSREHIHLKFLKDDTTTLVINCDLLEHMVNPLEIPHSYQFLLRTDSTFTVKNFEFSEVPIYDLIVVGRIPKIRLSDADCFGWPLILKPTQCWRFNWQESLENQQIFLSVNQFLLARNEVMLCRKKSDRNLPVGYFVICPLETGLAMALKSVVPRELMFSDSTQGVELRMEPTPGIIRHTVNSEMKQTRLIDDFSTEQHCNSGFYDAVTRTLVNFADQDGVFVFPTNVKKNVPRDQKKNPLKSSFESDAGLFNEARRGKTDGGSPKLSQSTMLNYSKVKSTSSTVANTTRRKENESSLTNVGFAASNPLSQNGELHSTAPSASYDTSPRKKSDPEYLSQKPESDRSTCRTDTSGTLSPRIAPAEGRDGMTEQNLSHQNSLDTTFFDGALVDTSFTNSQMVCGIKCSNINGTNELGMRFTGGDINRNNVTNSGTLLANSNASATDGPTDREMKWPSGMNEFSVSINENATSLNHTTNLGSIQTKQDGRFSNRQMAHAIEWSKDTNECNTKPNGSIYDSENLRALSAEHDGTFDFSSSAGQTVVHGVELSNCTNGTIASFYETATNYVENSRALSIKDGKVDSSHSNGQALIAAEWQNDKDEFSIRSDGIAIKHGEDLMALSIEPERTRELTSFKRHAGIEWPSCVTASNARFNGDYVSRSSTKMSSKLYRTTSFVRRKDVRAVGAVIKSKLKAEPKKKVHRSLKQLKVHLFFDKV